MTIFFTYFEMCFNKTEYVCVKYSPVLQQIHYEEGIHRNITTFKKKALSHLKNKNLECNTQVSLDLFD